MLPKRPAPKKVDEVVAYITTKLEALRQRDTNYHFSVMNSLCDRLGPQGLHEKMKQRIHDRAQAEGTTQYKFIDDLFKQQTPAEWLGKFYGA